jgi:hypothetical protein
VLLGGIQEGGHRHVTFSLPKLLAIPQPPQQCTAHLLNHGVKLGANRCSSRTTGFMCSQCADGYSKVAGECYDCPGFDWVTLLFSLTVNILTGLLLLHQSTADTISKTEIELIWHKVDKKYTDELDLSGIRKLLNLMGSHPTDDKIRKLMLDKFHAKERQNALSSHPSCGRRASFAVAPWSSWTVAHGPRFLSGWQ